MTSYSSQPYASKQGFPQLSEHQQEKVVAHLELVKWIVNRIVERLPPHIDSADLMHTGILGLIDAAQRFHWGRPNEDNEFKAYAECRIRGQVMDELRSMDVLPRSTREKVNHFNKALVKLRNELKREPTEEEMCQHLDIDIEIYHRMRREATFGRQVTIDTGGAQDAFIEGILRQTLELVDPTSPEALIHVEEVKSILAEEIDRLSERERQVVSLYYFEELTFKEIGKIFSITESRVSQIHSQAVGKLMRRLQRTFGTQMPLDEDDA